MDGMDYDYSGGKTKKYCISGKYVAIICAVVAAVGLSVGLGVGLTRPEPCKKPEYPSVTTNPPSIPTSTPADMGPCPPSVETGEWDSFRLSTSVSPEHYDLEIEPDMEGGTYTGTVTIHIKVQQNTRYLRLHIRELSITAKPQLQIQSESSSLQDISLSRCFEFKKQEYLVVEADQALQPTQALQVYLLTLKFKGSLDGSLVGFYRTSYTEKGQKIYIAATDHEPTDARKSFPCFDEPNKKATYSISIVHSDPYKAISNMPAQSSTVLNSGKFKTTFEKSVPMSTYLVAFAVHRFTYVERISSRGIPLRIYVQPEQKDTAEYAANVTKVVFDAFEKYFNMDYSIGKLDKIAIPDFGTGAMENWGLITYRETNLLYDQNESSSTNQQRVAAVVAHELVHQWFGNIVTMEWWDDLWLNEGFASFFEYIGVNAAEPGWRMLDQMLVDDFFPVMADDALLSSHPIIVSVSTPAEITSVFDGISYSKGASILRMLQQWMGEENFQSGCQAYLKRFKFENAKTDDFWEALAQVSKLPVKEVMDTWTRQMGYPVLTLTSPQTVNQSRFLLDPNADPSEPPSELKYKWNIPINWNVLNGTNGSIFYNMSHQGDLTLNGYSPTDGILKINSGHVGFYRVLYATESWGKITEQLMTSHKGFSTADRAGFFDDAFALARANLLDYGIALNLTQYLTKENDYMTWHRVSSALSYIRTMLEDDLELYPKFQKYWRAQVKPISDQLQWQDTGSHLERLLRETVLGIACRMEDEDALANASRLFKEWLAGKSIEPNLRLLVYRYGMQAAGDETSWQYMLEQYSMSTLAQEKDKLLYGLASVQDVKLLNRYLTYIKNSTVIKTQDVFTVLRYISFNKYGKTMAWDWTRLNWEYLVDRYTLNDRNLGRLISRITDSFNTELQLWQMESFFELYPEAGAGEMPRKQAHETLKNNIEWVHMNRKEIQDWLDTVVIT
ncbi:glutamyl aminopeptidase [Protopterus annectens]|uniref:glutamyl aminopeptidase n=1 Tax=Protopterus annectens TaxID=7888 RepID=UPI001CF9E932|nr:glutamyl aminopeptidase [Protopterus annectens]XP_043917397.1 glutamyl aminopeptidase [Protopterus annectens]